MSKINDTINNFNLDQLKVAVEQQNNGLLKEVYTTMMGQQETIIALHERVISLEKNSESFVSIIERLIAKIEILNAFVGDMMVESTEFETKEAE